MPVKIIILFSLFFCLDSNQINIQNSSIVKAWIEIEGEIQNLSVNAKLQSSKVQAMTFSYVLKTNKKGRSGSSNTIQKGKCIAQNNKIISLSESRMNLTKKDNLVVRLLVYHDNKIVAQDSVVFHGDNY